MNTNNTTRTAVRASVLTAVLTGLLLGAPAIAFADTSATPAQPSHSAIVNLPPQHSTGGSIAGQSICGTRIAMQSTDRNGPCYFGLA